MRTISAEGTRAITSSASSTSAAVAAPKLVPRCAASSTAAMHLGVGVAEDQRAPGADPVDVAVAVDVDQLAALAALDEDRLALDLPHRPHGRVDAAGKDLQRAPVQLGRALVTRNALPPSDGTRR